MAIVLHTDFRVHHTINEQCQWDYCEKVVMAEVYKDGQCRCDLPITMATDITPHQLSMALQYVGVQFCWFSCAMQQLARQSRQPPLNWFQQVEAEVVGGKYVYNITFNHCTVCTGTNPCCI